MVDRVLPARYDLLRPLGAGGMGEVFLVRDRESGRELALKRMRRAPDGQLVGGEAGRHAFKQAFWALVALAQPHLVAAHEYAEAPDGTPCYTMDHVAGADLATLGVQPEAAVRAWLPGLAQALAGLHARGYVHGDLKPQSVRLAADGRPVLLDLGRLARAGRAGEEVRGTPAYLAPEAIRLAALDARTDLYALGVLLYEVLAGRPPFGEASGLALRRAHLSRTPEPLAGVSPAMGQAVMRLLAKDPADRFASAGDLLTALGLEGGAVAGQPLLSSPIVGREDAQAALAALVAGDGAGVGLVGVPGAGKSRLLAETRAEAQLVGLRTYAARGLGLDAAPYAALAPWLRALTAEPSALRERLAPVLARVLPELGVAPAPDLAGVLPARDLAGEAERLRLHAAVAELAQAQAGAALWLLDDADRLDPASAALVAFLHATGPASWRWALAWREPVGLDGALAPGPAGPAGCLLPVERVVLPALTPGQGFVVAQGLLGQRALPGAVMAHLTAFAGGTPGAIEAVVAHWVRTGALVREAGRWVEAAGVPFELPGGLAVAPDVDFEALGKGAAR